tara:strand:- start:7427 stop:7759 length:333 start_codon:yes stop_codon:yes gene_type:complete
MKEVKVSTTVTLDVKEYDKIRKVYDDRQSLLNLIASRDERIHRLEYTLRDGEYFMREERKDSMSDKSKLNEKIHELVGENAVLLKEVEVLTKKKHWFLGLQEIYQHKAIK